MKTPLLKVPIKSIPPPNPLFRAPVKSAAVEQTAVLLKLPLRMAGRPDVKVVAEFASD